MTEKQSDTKETPIEELQCHKKYVYDTGIIFECKNNCKSEIIGEDVVRLLNELATKCSQLKKENEQLKKENESMEKTLDKLIQLKETEIKQQRFFIELIEEVLPLDDSIKRGIHQRTIRSNIYD